ncbi:putative protease [Shewanella phage SFCi1]|nr:putative protease [Shewanella phage SFCi1]
MLWLLERGVLDAISAPVQLTAHQIERAMRADDDDDNGNGYGGNASNVLVKSGDSATITIQGVMTSQRSFMAYYFGGGNTLYKDIDAAIDSVEMDPSIKRVDFMFCSGGGEAQPALSTADKIAAMKKPTRAIVKTAASAAYWLASQADTIVAVNKASQVGSIGTMVEMAKPSLSTSMSVTSTNAPNKRPDPETPEGQAAVKEWLDQSADLFATAVAVGRDKTVETVNNTFGRGGMLLADKALEVGMIDSIGVGTTESPAQGSPSATTTGAKTMDLATLKADHPSLYNAVLDEGKQIGAAAELDRVKFHGLMGQKTGATAFALQACLAGTPMNDVEATVEYATFGRNNADIEAREQDETQLANNAPASTDDDAREAAAVAQMFDMAGVL